MASAGSRQALIRLVDQYRHKSSAIQDLLSCDPVLTRTNNNTISRPEVLYNSDRIIRSLFVGVELSPAIYHVSMIGPQCRLLLCTIDRYCIESNQSIYDCLFSKHHHLQFLSDLYKIGVAYANATGINIFYSEFKTIWDLLLGYLRLMCDEQVRLFETRLQHSEIALAMPPEAIHEIENPPRDGLEFYREYCRNTSQQLARAMDHWAQKTVPKASMLPRQTSQQELPVQEGIPRYHSESVLQEPHDAYRPEIVEDAIAMPKEVQIPGSTTLSNGRSTTPDYFGVCSDESSVALGAELHQLATHALERAKTEKQTSTIQGRVQKSRSFTRQFQPNLPEIQRLLNDQTSPSTARPRVELSNVQRFINDTGSVKHQTSPTTAPPPPELPNFQSLFGNLGVVTPPTTAARPELLDVRNRKFSAIPALSLKGAQCLKIELAYRR